MTRRRALRCGRLGRPARSGDSFTDSETSAGLDLERGGTLRDEGLEHLAPAGRGAPDGGMPAVGAAVPPPILGGEAARLRLRAEDLRPAAVAIDDLVAAGED